MPESYSLERRKVVRAFGARLVLTDASKGMDGAIEKAEEMVASDPDRYVMPNQFKNPDPFQNHGPGDLGVPLSANANKSIGPGCWIRKPIEKDPLAHTR